MGSHHGLGAAGVVLGCCPGPGSSLKACSVLVQPWAFGQVCFNALSFRFPSV